MPSSLCAWNAQSTKINVWVLLICIGEAASPIRRVMKIEEIDSFQDLGLGRGVDATNPTPWLNKRPLQIREVTYSDIIGILRRATCTRAL